MSDRPASWCLVAFWKTRPARRSLESWPKKVFFCWTFVSLLPKFSYPIPRTPFAQEEGDFMIWPPAVADFLARCKIVILLANFYYNSREISKKAKSISFVLLFRSSGHNLSSTLRHPTIWSGKLWGLHLTIIIHRSQNRSSNSLIIHSGENIQCT